MLRSSLTLVFACLVSVVIARGEEWKLPEEKINFKQAPGADLVKANCLICHSSEYITTQPPFTPDQWKASVTKMKDKYGAPVTDEAVQPLVEYLAANYGKSAR